MRTRECRGRNFALTAVWPLAPVLLMALALTAQPASAQTLNVTVLSGLDGTTVVNDYRWLLEKDLMYHVPFEPGPNPGDPEVPVVENDMQALSFHRSYMPVVAEGLSSDGVVFVREADTHYFISVLPTSGYSIGGAQIAPGDTDVTVFVNPLPIPTAQIVVQVCEDINPINNVCDPGEAPLEGFEVIIEDAGGRYGMSAGFQSYDIWGNPLGTTYLDDHGTVDELGSGINTGPDGTAYIKNLAPGKYGVIIVPPAGQGWQQTSTIEGKKIIDAWVKANEPPYFAEFGPPGPHVFAGFVRPFNNLGTGSGATVKGQGVNLHMSRPPEFAMYSGGPFPHTNCWVGLNDFSGGVPGAGLYIEPCGNNGYFTIPDIPAGTYQLVMWDDNLDLIFLAKTLTVNADGTCYGDPLNGIPGRSCNLGPIPQRQWFTRMEHWVFNDTNGDGRRQCVTESCNNPGLGDEIGIPEQAVNLRWRDGTMYQSFATDLYGFAPFDEVFPFFAWLVAEVDFARLNATGATVFVDDGGGVPFLNPNSWDGQLNPQSQNLPLDPGMWIHEGYDDGGPADQARTESGVVLTQAFQGFLGQTSVVEWGKAPHDGDGNGGIGGVVYYSVTRAENDPRYGGAEPWEPGIPGVTVNLYTEAGEWVATTTTDSWDENPPTNCQYGSSFAFVFDEGGDLEKTIDCYDGMRNWNQVRPGLFDGGYAFDEVCNGPLDEDGNCLFGTTSPIPMGRYVVEVIPPSGYQVVKSQDKNVDFGDEYVASALLLPPECAGSLHQVPDYLSLNSDGFNPLPGVTFDELVPAPLATQWMPDCDRKKVAVSGGNNAAADFFLFTQVPIAAHAVGFILDDTANEFDPSSPQFGEKYAPPFLPVSIRDWTGREIGRTYSDAYGRYNFVAPSTWTNNLPQPSGMSPNMLTTCMNAKMMPDGTADPMHNPQYSQFCYTFQYMPGATVYLDTPVVPVAAFTGSDQFPLDCEFADGTPRIYSVTNSALQGPFVTAAGDTITITSMGSVQVPNPEYEGLLSEGSVPKFITRDFGFGCDVALPVASVGGVAMTGLACSQDADGRDVLTGAVGDSGGQLVVTRSDNGISSINSVTVQMGLRKRASLLTVPGMFPTIQEAIDAAGANDLILVAPRIGGGAYQEMVIMWKPVQLQGWGEGTRIDAVKAPPESLQAWRQKVEDLVNGGQVTLVPGQEAAFGGIEPAALWTEEGAGVIVLAKAGDFSEKDNQKARIDGFTISGADTGGGIILNGYASDMQVSNNRLINNQGQYGGGIRLGHPYLTAEGAGCARGDICYPDAKNYNVTISNNHVNQNGGISGAGGGVSICTGSDGYALIDNYICGNFNMQQGGGVAHYGFSGGKNMIARNVIAFNESFNQGLTVAGGGLLVAGQPELCAAGGPNCGDPLLDLSAGSGEVTIQDNLIHGNAAEAGDGGGIRLQKTNGQDVAKSPNSQGQWYKIDVFNNIISNNVAALSGGGISLADAKRVNIAHNTITNNDNTSTAGTAFVAAVGELQSAAQPGAGVVSHSHSPALLAYQKRSDEDFSDAKLSDNIVWENRWFAFNGIGTTVDPNTEVGWYGLCPAIGGLAENCATVPAPHNGTTAV
ncbi:MAG: right-handed parallel beta-helix repeat-containing protein, partial [Candidatus Sulfomarinibacteraceae bacterium]